MTPRPTLVLALAILVSGCVEQEESAQLEEKSNISEPRALTAEARPTGRPETGDQFPDFEALTLDGETWAFDPKDQELAMINLWATWCGPCRYEIPDLIELEDEWRDRGLRIVGVSLDAPGAATKIREFADSMEINYLIVHDARQRLLDSLRTPVIPTTALVDSEGEIVWMHYGMVRKNDPGLNRALATHLGEEGEKG